LAGESHVDDNYLCRSYFLEDGFRDYRRSQDAGSVLVDLGSFSLVNCEIGHGCIQRLTNEIFPDFPGRIRLPRVEDFQEMPLLRSNGDIRSPFPQYNKLL
jgi:hypothetical protein